MEYLVDRIFPTKEIHIIAGASGVGKTTFGFQLLDEWRQGKPVLGFPSHPQPFVYVSCDRSRQSVNATLQRVGVRHIDFVDGRGVARYGEQAFDMVLKQARAIVPEVRLLFVEAFSMLVPQASFKDTYRVTGQFLSEMSRVLAREDVTIIGTAHSPKQRDNDQINDPRQLVLGTVAWGGFIETIVAIRRLKPLNPSDMRRQVLVLPRNAREEAFDYDLDENGRFVKIEQTTVCDILNVLLEVIPLDEMITTSSLVELAERAGVTARRTIERWITQSLEDGRLIRVGKGIYKRIPKQ